MGDNKIVITDNNGEENVFEILLLMKMKRMEINMSCIIVKKMMSRSLHLVMMMIIII